MSELSAKQQLFVEHYLTNPNATKAALAAGYSEKTAYSQGQRLLKHVEINRLCRTRLTKAIMSAEDVLTEIAEVARADWREFVEVQMDKDGNTVKAQLKLSDKLKALELAGKYHKLFTDKTEIITSTAAQNIEAYIRHQRDTNPLITIDELLECAKEAAIANNADWSVVEPKIVVTVQELGGKPS